MSFLQKVDSVINPILNNIIGHPFLQELANGTLDNEIFTIYLEQDYFYLVDYVKVLTRLSELSLTSERKIFFNACAASCSTEPAFDIKERILSGVVKRTNASTNYIKYISDNIGQSYESGMFAVFPCFYIYYLVAQKLYPADKSSRYIAWFDVYVSQLFVTQTKKITEFLEQEFNAADAADQERFLNIVKIGAQHEWNFWDDCYVKQTA